MKLSLAMSLLLRLNCVTAINNDDNVRTYKPISGSEVFFYLPEVDPLFYLPVEVSWLP